MKKVKDVVSAVGSFVKERGEYNTKSATIATAMKTKKRDDEWIYIIDLNGSHERWR